MAKFSKKLKGKEVGDAKVYAKPHTMTVEELYAVSDVISLHIPATAETKKSINAEILGRMPKGAVLVNTARKEVIDEASILEFMQSRPDFKYVTDIVPGNDAEMKEKVSSQYFTTPKKMGAQTSEANINAGIAAASQIVDFLKNGNQKFKVN